MQYKDISINVTNFLNKNLLKWSVYVMNKICNILLYFDRLSCYTNGLKMHKLQNFKGYGLIKLFLKIPDTFML